MSVMLTESAAKEVKRVLSEQSPEESAVLRVGILAGGCSGFQYRLEFDKEDQVDSNADTITDQHGVKVVVDKKSALYLEGTTLDFYEGIDKRGFHFDNPNVVKSCGCGSSFQA